VVAAQSPCQATPAATPWVADPAVALAEDSKKHKKGTKKRQERYGIKLKSFNDSTESYNDLTESFNDLVKSLKDFSFIPYSLPI
jgi:hypothetical protein